MKSRFVVVMAVAAMLLCSSVSFGATYSDVVTALQTEIPGVVPGELNFNAECLFHQDTFVASDLLRLADGTLWTPDSVESFVSPGAASTVGSGGYIVVNNPDYSDGADVADRVVSYGAGNINRDALYYGEVAGGSLTDFEVSSRLKIAYGNLATKTEVITSAGDTATYGYALAIDTQVPFDPDAPVYLIVPSVRIDDTDNDGKIQFDTLYDFSVDEGSANLYYDRNRDGEVDINDRAFMVVYEDDKDNSRVNLSNPTDPDIDGDGVLVDNYWVGNPYAPMADADPEIYKIGNFADPLVIGYLENVKANTTINLVAAEEKPKEANQQLKFELTATYDLAVVGGRLLDYYNTMSTLGYTLNGTWNYDILFNLGSPDDGEELWSPELNVNRFMEFRGTGNTYLYTFENPVSEPSAALLLLGSLAGVAVRKRRR
jgi:hypothetical protein